jgi:hypothetical protein
VSDLKIDYGDLHSLVEESHKAKERKRSKKGRVARWARNALLWVVASLVLATLPFFALVRVGVFAYREWALGTWPSLGVAAVATALILAAYAWLVGRRLGAGRGVRRLLTRGAAGIAIAYVAYALVYVAGANVKSEDVRGEYRSLHPLLRVAAAAVFVVDGETVMTDAGRVPEDYWLMGLPVNEASLHFEQDDGFVHALDIRTRGRREWRNRGLELAFWAMGFHALRHVGTADHLHVSLRMPR